MSEMIVDGQQQVIEEMEEMTPEVRAKKLAKLEQKLVRYFQNKEIAKERNEENKLLFEELEDLFEAVEEQDFVHQLPNGEFAVLTKKPRIREKLDKEALANELQIAKDELKTPFDYSMLTQQGKLTPKMVSTHTQTEVKVKLTAAKKKRKPKKKKEDR